MDASLDEEDGNSREHKCQQDQDSSIWQRVPDIYNCHSANFEKGGENKNWQNGGRHRDFTRQRCDNFPSCSSSSKKSSTPTLPMTRREEIAERRLLVVHDPEERKIDATRVSWRAASYRVSASVVRSTSSFVCGP